MNDNQSRMKRILSHSLKGTNIAYQNVVKGRALRRDHPHRQRERMFNQMSRLDLKDYWLAELSKLENAK